MERGGLMIRAYDSNVKFRVRVPRAITNAFNLGEEALILSVYSSFIFGEPGFPHVYELECAY